MYEKISSILICGAGQLGSRYLQGLAKYRKPLRICVQDACGLSLEMAKQRWGEVQNEATQHEVTYSVTLSSLPGPFDVVIVATTADVRPQMVNEIACHAAVRYWVLEKVLAQGEEDLDAILAGVKGSAGVWVNTPRRMMPWHQQIRSQLGLGKPLTLKIAGGAWGMACNAIHYLDLMAWWSGETLNAVDTVGLDPEWFESKRMGNWEVSGTLDAKFSGGSHALLCAVRQGPYVPLKVVGSDRLSWLIDEAEGKAYRSDGLEVPGGIINQSAMSALLVEAILESGRCDLPSLEESALLHRVFIRNMLEHWKRAGHSAEIRVPIT